MKMNLWKSLYTGWVYEMDINWMPKCGGWELVGTIEVQFQQKIFKKSIDKVKYIMYNVYIR